MFLTHTKPVQAKLVGTTVVAAFRNSNPSLIWKYDLERNHSFTLALQGEEGDFELGVTSPKGDFSPVARFATREDADEAFLAVQKVLMKRKWSRLRTIMAGIAGVMLMFFTYNLISGLLSNSFHAKAVMAAAPPAATKPLAAQPELLQGVPMSADQLLQPPP